MNSHKFAIGERVDYRPTMRHQTVMGGDFQVESQLPADEHGNNQYRIESRVDGHRRVVHESELAPLGVSENAAS